MAWGKTGARTDEGAGRNDTAGGLTFPGMIAGMRCRAPCLRQMTIPAFRGVDAEIDGGRPVKGRGVFFPRVIP